MNFSIPESSKNRHIELLAFITLCFAVMVVLIVRAIKVPVSHDEATTYFNYVQSANFIPFLAKGEANNHFLNSFLTYIFVHLFGTSPLVLRLSNLVFAPLYFFFCYKISRELSSVILRWIFLPVMVFTFHMIEFFALTRGYGLSLTFLAGAIWQVFLASRTGNYKHFLYCNIFMLLSSLSILLEVYNFALLLGWSLAMIVFNPGNGKLKKIILVFLTGALPIVLLVLLTLHLQKEGAYIEHGPTGLWDATLKTLFCSITEMNPYQAQTPLLILTTLTALPIILLLASVIVKKKWHIHPNMLFPYLLGGNLLIIVIVVKFFFNFYPESRLVLFLFPITVGTILFTVDLLNEISRKKLFFILAFPLLFFPIQSVKLMNFEYITWYNTCHIPMRFYDTVMAEHKNGEIPPTIGCRGLQRWAWQFLARQRGSVANEMTTEGFPDRKSKYEIRDLQTVGGWRSYYDDIDYDPVSSLHLLKKKGIEQKILLSDSVYKGITTRTNSESIIILERGLDEFRDKNVLMELDLSLSSFGKLLYGAVVISISDSSNQNLIYDEIHLNWIREHWDGEPHNFLRSWAFPSLPRNAVYIRIYIWNIKKSDFAINEGKITFFELK